MCGHNKYNDSYALLKPWAETNNITDWTGYQTSKDAMVDDFREKYIQYMCLCVFFSDDDNIMKHLHREH